MVGHEIILSASADQLALVMCWRSTRLPSCAADWAVDEVWGVRSIARIDVIIVNWYTERLLPGLLSDLENQVGVVVNVHVVDNGSGHGAMESLLETHNFNLVPAGANLGYTGGNNLGFAHANLEGGVCVINPDVRCSDPRTLATLWQALADYSDLAACAPLLIVEDGLIDYAGSAIDLARARAVHTRTNLTQWPPELGSVQRVAWVDGAMMMIRGQTIRETGGFDPRYFLYAEEVDLCLRMADAGYAVALVSTVRVRHMRSLSMGSSPKGAYYYWRNLYLLCSDHHRGFGWRVHWVVHLLAFALRRRHWRPSLSRHALLGGLDAVRGVTGPMRGEA